MRVRAHVRIVAAVWLACQAVAFAAAPFVLCNDHGVMRQIGDGHEHHQHSSEPASTASNDAALNCRCTVSDAALAALTLESGILTSELVLETRLVTARVVLPDDATPTRFHQTDTPPPRA
jgi:hypothetical protein